MLLFTLITKHKHQQFDSVIATIFESFESVKLRYRSVYSHHDETTVLLTERLRLTINQHEGLRKDISVRN